MCAHAARRTNRPREKNGPQDDDELFEGRGGNSICKRARLYARVSAASFTTSRPKLWRASRGKKRRIGKKKPRSAGKNKNTIIRFSVYTRRQMYLSRLRRYTCREYKDVRLNYIIRCRSRRSRRPPACRTKREPAYNANEIISYILQHVYTYKHRGIYAD